MCAIGAASKAAQVARFLQRYPGAGRAGGPHPALGGCTDVPWSKIAGCPAGMPDLLYALLDPVAAPKAIRVLDNVLFDSPLHLSAAMPTALPYLVRLAADPAVPVHRELLELLDFTAEASQPADDQDGRPHPLLGSDSNHPEREQCRAVLAQHTALLSELPGDRAPGTL